MSDMSGQGERPPDKGLQPAHYIGLLVVVVVIVVIIATLR